MKELWNSLPDSTRRALKTFWQAFFGTFVMTVCVGLSNGLMGWDAFKMLLFSALSAAIAAAAAKVANYLMNEWDTEDVYKED